MDRSPLLTLFILFAVFSLGACAADDDDDDSTGDDDSADDDADDDDNDDDDSGPPDLDGIIPGPDEPGFDPELELKAFRYGQQFHGISAYPFGMSLDVFISDQGMRDLVDDWLTESEVTQGFEEYTGVPVYDVMDGFGEYGDLGMFGGMASIGDVFRYALARDTDYQDVAPIAELRQNVIDLMEVLHACMAITGNHGGWVRGIRPPGIPGWVYPTVPLFDEHGNPLPEPKAGAWREDNSTGGLYPGWTWMDDTSKDQVDGFILALGVVWDIVVDDPDIPEELKDDLRADAAAFGDHLMEVAPETGLDLTLRDADGRLTGAHDVNPRELEGFVFPPGIGNGFNALMALGFIKTVVFITQDQKYIDFYDDLVYERDFPQYIDLSLKFTCAGPFTNWSNVNMIYCAIYPLLRYEANPALRSYYQEVMLRDLWQSWMQDWPVAQANYGLFNVIYSAFAKGPTDDAAADLAAEDLAGFPWPPFWNAPYIENCDAAELAAGRCIGADGVTEIEIAGYYNFNGDFIFFPGHGDIPQATQPIPRHIRPPSDFNWRSSPYDLNGGGGPGLDPGGDFHGAYWLGRYLRRSDDSTVNVSPHAL